MQYLAQNNPDLLEELTRSPRGRRLSRGARRELARNNPELLAELEKDSGPGKLVSLVIRIRRRR